MFYRMIWIYLMLIFYVTVSADISGMRDVGSDSFGKPVYRVSTRKSESEKLNTDLTAIVHSSFRLNAGST